MKKIISLSLVFVMMLSLCSCSAGYKPFTQSFTDLFDTASTITAYDTSQKSFNKHYDEVYKRIKEYSKLFDAYNSYGYTANIKYLNENAARRPIKVKTSVISILKYGKRVYEQTNGRVNIAFGSVTSIWHDKMEEGKELPSIEDLAVAGAHCNIDDIVIDESNNTVFFADSDIKIDIGAIAKGYVCEQIAKYITDNKIWKSAIISLGGNVKTIGSKGNVGQYYNVGIQDPQGGKELLCTVKAKKGMSVVTSGDYQRFYEVDGKFYCHIINPDSLTPSRYMASVTVMCENSALADAYSTALFNLPINGGKEFVENQYGVEAMWVDSDNNITYSSGFQEYLE